MSSDSVGILENDKSKKQQRSQRIPQHILLDHIYELLQPLSILFDKILHQNQIPNQWQIAKLTPIFKKGSVNKIKNYRPILNPSSVSKTLKKLVQKRLLEQQDENKVVITGQEQHGFKKHNSMATEGPLLQSIIANHTDIGECVLMASLDISVAFNIVNVPLLLKWLENLGLPDDVLRLLKTWITNKH